MDKEALLHSLRKLIINRPLIRRKTENTKDKHFATRSITSVAPEKFDKDEISL